MNKGQILQLSRCRYPKYFVYICANVGSIPRHDFSAFKVLLKKWTIPGLCFRLFSVISKETSIQFYNKLM